MSDRLSGLRAALGASVICVTAAPLATFAAPPAHSDIFDAALCQPPFTADLMDSAYNTAKAADPKPDESMPGTAVYRLPEPIHRDGFTTRHVVFVSTGIGVLVDGEVAGRLAKRYPLALEKGHLPGASSVGYLRRLTVRGPGGALIRASARQRPALKDKTLLACETTTEENIKALERMEQH
ncbi:hypothetical protein [Burkholderia seminalis]|uniref:hypothetical protein n=1 Tax=Burkholderia seminalis TaxID=488731 RepID=UPI000F5963D0|nr:hypothetical protein [Burkholderia seminalis]RQS92323.1 hypothetical protein DF048_18745 [Burkholderia seminalis]